MIQFLKENLSNPLYLLRSIFPCPSCLSSLAHSVAVGRITTARKVHNLREPWACGGYSPSLLEQELRISMTCVHSATLAHRNMQTVATDHLLHERQPPRIRMLWPRPCHMDAPLDTCMHNHSRSYKHTELSLTFRFEVFLLTRSSLVRILNGGIGSTRGAQPHMAWLFQFNASQGQSQSCRRVQITFIPWRTSTGRVSSAGKALHRCCQQALWGTCHLQQHCPIHGNQTLKDLWHHCL